MINSDNLSTEKNDGILVIAEYIDKRMRAITSELVGCALSLSDITDLQVTLLHVRGIDHSESEKIRSFLSSLIRELSPSFVIMGHTSQGLDTAPGLAARLGCGCITGVNSILPDESSSLQAPADDVTSPDRTLSTKTSPNEYGVLFSRSIFKGKMNAFMKYAPLKKPLVLTIQPGSFPALTQNELNELEKTGKFKNLTLSYNQENSAVDDKGRCREEESRTEILSRISYEETVHSRNRQSGLQNAKVIVSAGRGIGKKENIEQIEKFAASFSDSAVAGSRPLIDMGWMPYDQQVGITGTVVSPDLYIAVGISGSSQHIAGMKNSKFIVSINSDPNAAIFNISDVSIVEDCLDFITTFLELSEKKT